MTHIVFPDAANDIVLLLVRLVVALSFIVAARNKGRNLKKFAKNNGLPLPAAFLVMCVELTAGTALALGVLAQFAALALMLLMLGTLRLHIFVWKSPYWAGSGGWEYDLMLLILAAVIAVHGAGQYSLAR